jgi:transcription termination factor Rho
MNENETTPEAAPMEEKPVDKTEATTTPTTEATKPKAAGPTVVTEEPPLNLPASLDVNELQALAPEQIEKLCRDFQLRIHPGRSRHHFILDLVRAALGRKIPVRTTGFFDPVADNFGVLRWPRLNFLSVPEDVGVSRGMIQQFALRPAQKIRGTVRLPRDREKLIMLDEIEAIEGVPVAEWKAPTVFDNLTPLFPQGRIMLENSKTNSISARAVDLLSPLGRGQRGLIVAAPRVGKTILLKEIAKAIRVNHPEILLIILLVDERPEEVTDLQREVDCDVYNSTFDENSKRHVEVAELVLERAKRLVEQNKDVVILLDSITRLARGYNSLQPGKGRTMSGGVEAKALLKPKKFFGAARNCEEGGSLTIIATALVDTGSKMDQVIFEEFKGTGNMELHLDRALVEKRLYPAIHCLMTGTRREDLLYHPEEWERVQLLRKAMAALPPIEAMEKLIDNLNATKTNAELLLSGLR